MMNAKDLQLHNNYNIRYMWWSVMYEIAKESIVKEVIKILYAELDACIQQNSVFVQMLCLTDHMQIYI